MYQQLQCHWRLQYLGEVGEPYGIYTLLGWAIYGIPGKLNNQVLAHFCSTQAVVKDGMENLEEQFKTYIGKEFSERLNDDRIAMSAEDNKFLDKVADSIQYKDGHYEIKLPFQHGQARMPNNNLQPEQRAKVLLMQVNHRCFQCRVFFLGDWGVPPAGKNFVNPPPIRHLSPFLDQGLSPPSQDSSPKIWKI